MVQDVLGDVAGDVGDWLWGSNDGNHADVRDHRDHSKVHDHRGYSQEESEIEALLQSSPSALAEADRTLDELRARLDGTYEFTVLEPGTVNYGILLSYRQEWSPHGYQVGRLVDTIPLSPGERREFRVSTSRKVHENRRTVSTSTHEAQRESSASHRLESEAIEAATTAMNNQVSTTGSFNIGVGSIGGSSQFDLNTAAESRRVLKTSRRLHVRPSTRCANSWR
ncbi:hypothetical protein [Amycolatopsis sp. NPDC003861]